MATFRGQVRFLQDAGLDDPAAYVHHAAPAIVFVEELESWPEAKKSTAPIVISPVALFDECRRRSSNEFGFTFVQCVAGSDPELNDAADWIQKYAAKHGGKIVTNFDERSPILADAPLSYQRLVKRTYDRTIIQHLHLERLADRIDFAAQTEYNNYGQVGAMGDNARSDSNTFRGSKKSKPRK
jgi:hypothetical protein